MHLIILVRKIKITFQKAQDNFAFKKKIHYLLSWSSVCLSVCLSTQKSYITFFPVDLLAPNFQGHLNSLQLVFWCVTWTPGPSGSGPDPKRVFLPNLSPPGVLVQGGFDKPFWNQDGKAKKNLGSSTPGSHESENQKSKLGVFIKKCTSSYFLTLA